MGRVLIVLWAWSPLRTSLFFCTARVRTSSLEVGSTNSRDCGNWNSASNSYPSQTTPDRSTWHTATVGVGSIAFRTRTPPGSTFFSPRPSGCCLELTISWGSPICRRRRPGCIWLCIAAATWLPAPRQRPVLEGAFKAPHREDFAHFF